LRFGNVLAFQPFERRCFRNDKDQGLPMKKLLIAAMMMALTAPTTPALADRHDRRDRRAYERHREARVMNRNDRIWRGNDGRYHCRRNDGTTGLIIGAGVGALAGRAVDTRGDRTLGTVIGAVGGGLLGRSIDRGEMRCQ